MTALALHLAAFFEQHLPVEHNASQCTRDSYGYAFQLLLTYASQRLKVAPSQLALEQIDAPLVVDPPSAPAAALDWAVASTDEADTPAPAAAAAPAPRAASRTLPCDV